jgi:nucleoside 2-deoxyribosyltransferase
VFFPDATLLLERKADLARRYGFEPVTPADQEPQTEPAAGVPLGMEISRINEALIDAADLCIANLTPFRGVSADPGTVFEVGYAVGRGKPVFGYTTDDRDYLDRVAAAIAAGAVVDGTAIENHGMSDNLMIEGALLRRGGTVIRLSEGTGSRWHELVAFEECLGRAAASLD